MCRSDLQASLDAFPAAIHEFRVPPKALLGLHSYCPVHFDTFHAVVVDLSVHITLLKAGVHAPTRKESRFVTGSSFYTDKKNMPVSKLDDLELHFLLGLKHFLSVVVIMW